MGSLQPPPKNREAEIWRVEFSRVEKLAADHRVQSWHLALHMFGLQHDACWDRGLLEVGVDASQEILPGPQRRHADEFVNS
jgi:hypothetical protein